MLDALVYIIQAIVGFITALVLLFIDASIPNVKNILCFDFTTVDQYIPPMKNIYSYAIAISFAILIVTTLFSLLNTMINTQENADSPISIIGRMLLCMLGIFSVTKIAAMISSEFISPTIHALWKTSDGDVSFTAAFVALCTKMHINALPQSILNSIGQMAGGGIVTKVIKMMIKDYDPGFGMIITTVLFIPMVKDYVKLLWEILQRFLTIVFLSYTAPFAFSLGVSSDTRDVSKKWIRMYFGQLFIFVINILLLTVFINAIDGTTFSATDGFNGLIWIALYTCYLRMAAQVDNLFLFMGFNISPIGVGRDLFSMAEQGLSGIGHAIGKGLHAIPSMFKSGAHGSAAGQPYSKNAPPTPGGVNPAGAVGGSGLNGNMATAAISSLNNALQNDQGRFSIAPPKAGDRFGALLDHGKPTGLSVSDNGEIGVVRGNTFFSSGLALKADKDGTQIGTRDANGNFTAKDNMELGDLAHMNGYAPLLNAAGQNTGLMVNADGKIVRGNSDGMPMKDNDGNVMDTGYVLGEDGKTIGKIDKDGNFQPTNDTLDDIAQNAGQSHSSAPNPGKVPAPDNADSSSDAEPAVPPSDADAPPEPDKSMPDSGDLPPPDDAVPPPAQPSGANASSTDGGAEDGKSNVIPFPVPPPQGGKEASGDTPADSKPSPQAQKVESNTHASDSAPMPKATESPHTLPKSDSAALPGATPDGKPVQNSDIPKAPVAEATADAQEAGDGKASPADQPLPGATPEGKPVQNSDIPKAPVAEGTADQDIPSSGPFDSGAVAVPAGIGTQGDTDDAPASPPDTPADTADGGAEGPSGSQTPHVVVGGADGDSGIGISDTSSVTVPDSASGDAPAGEPFDSGDVAVPAGIEAQGDTADAPAQPTDTPVEIPSAAPGEVHTDGTHAEEPAISVPDLISGGPEFAPTESAIRSAQQPQDAVIYEKQPTLDVNGISKAVLQVQNELAVDNGDGSFTTVMTAPDGNLVMGSEISVTDPKTKQLNTLLTGTNGEPEVFRIGRDSYYVAQGKDGHLHAVRKDGDGYAIVPGIHVNPKKNRKLWKTLTENRRK